MEKAPNLWRMRDLVDSMNQCQTEIKPDGWVPARPIGTFSIKNRLRLAWLVFTGTADALLWPGGQ